MIFNNLLAGLLAQSAGEKMDHLIGVTHHNIGIIHMCQGHFGDALRSFQKAVVVRKECLPQNHPDIAVCFFSLSLSLSLSLSCNGLYLTKIKLLFSIS